MAQAPDTSNRRDTKSPSNWASWVGFSALGLLLLAFVVLCAVLFFGHVKGVEFSPDKFQRRIFTYAEIPLIHLQVTPISHRDMTGNLEDYLVTNKLINTTGLQPRWDLVQASDGANSGEYGEAQILCMYLDARDDEGNIVWLDWTEKETAMAKIIWPAVAALAGQELYSFIPDLFLKARSASDAVQFQEDVDSTMAHNYVFVGRALQDVENHQKAVEYYSHALSYKPDHINALRGREQSYQAMGDTSSANADRIRLDVLSVEETATDAAS